MCNSTKAQKYFQTGEVLLESVIAMVVVSIFVGGPVYVMAKSRVMNVSTQAQIHAISQMTTLLHSEGRSLCNTNSAPTLTIQGVYKQLTVTCTSVGQIRVGPVLVESTAQRVTLSITDEKLFDGQTLSVWE